jgi:hypothetical protein
MESAWRPTLNFEITMHPLSQIIVSLQRRLLWRRRAVAACCILATGLVGAIVLGLVDYLTRYSDPGLRIMATAALMSALAWAVYHWWYLPQRQQLFPLAVARRVEAQFPKLQDSLASAIEFLRQSEEDEMAGSAQLRRLAIADAHHRVESLPLDEIIERRPLRQAAVALAFAISFLAVGLAIDPSAVRTAFARLAVPLGDVQWPRQHHLVFRDVPKQLAAGQTLELELVDTAGALPDDVRIEFRIARDGEREITSETMLRNGEVMIARRENITHSFAFRAQGGDDDTMPWHWVEVMTLPRITSMTITVHPPPYTGLPARASDRHIEVLAGTGIEVTGTTSAPIRAARIRQEQHEPIEAEIVNDAAGRERSAFHLSPQKWLATQSGPYKLELETDGGVPGVVAQLNLRVTDDSPPTLTWQRPGDDLYVLSRAIVPVEIGVKDDLAIQRVDLTYERSDRSESEKALRPKEPPIALYRGPGKPPAQPSDGAARGESRVVKYSWDLVPLQIPSGAMLTMKAEAADYRPAVGRTLGSRRIKIINPDELDARLADRQLQIVRQLERALAIERRTRDDVRRLEIQLREAGGMTRRDCDLLQTAEPNQRSVGRMLVDPAEGVPPLVAAIQDEIDINRLTASEMRDTLNRLSAELQRMSVGPLGVAERELTSARKIAESIATSKETASNALLPINPAQAADTSRLLASALGGQNDVTATLERLIGELSGKADYRRFARLIGELREDQIAHEKLSRAEIGTETLPLEVGELSRAQRANLEKAFDGQQALAERYVKIERGMDRLAQRLSEENDSMAGTLADAADLARRLTIGANMQQSAIDVRENRVNQALEREIKIAADLQQVLDILRNESERNSEQSAEKLNEAAQRMADLQQRLSNLREQSTQLEQAPNRADPEQQRQLAEQQTNVRQQIERLARELTRLQAAAAGKSTQAAADQIKTSPANQRPGGSNNQQPVPSSSIQKAQQHLQQAARQLAEKRQQAEDDLALDFVRRFQADLNDMIQRQQRVLKKTAELETERKTSSQLTPEQANSLARLANEERHLAELAKEHKELLSRLGAVQISLEEAERRLLTAGTLLDDRQTGPHAAQAEQLALARLEGMLQAFAQTANEAGQKANPNNDQAAPANDGQQQQPQRRPTYELLEVKMLRMLQAELNERTRKHEERVAEAANDQAAKSSLEQESRELAAEQGRLAELVQKMLTRDNGGRERK